MRGGAPLSPGAVLLLDRRLEAEQREARLPSIVAGIARRGEPAWFAAAGQTTSVEPSQTQYRCGSISKTFVAVSVLRLRDGGLIDLDDPLARHVPALARVPGTIVQYLSHTSGLRAETAGPWWERTPGLTFEELLRTSLRPEDFLRPPGRRYHYSNVGYALLGELVRLKRGAASYMEVVEEELLRPLGMLRTSARPLEPFAPGLGVHPHADVVLEEPEHDAAAMAPAGQLWTTAGDLLTWSEVLAGRRPALLSPETAAEMREPLALVDTPGLAWTAAQGMGLQLTNRAGRLRYGHGGSMPGFLAALRIEPDSGDALAVLTNATSGLRPALEDDLFAIVSTHDPAPRAAWAPVPGGLDEELLELTGTWYWGTTELVLSAVGSARLELTVPGEGREGSFVPDGAGSFVGTSGYYDGERLGIRRRPDRSVSHLDIGSFVLSRVPYDPSAEIPGGVADSGWQGSPA